MAESKIEKPFEAETKYNVTPIAIGKDAVENFIINSVNSKGFTHGFIINNDMDDPFTSTIGVKDGALIMMYDSAYWAGHPYFIYYTSGRLFAGSLNISGNTFTINGYKEYMSISTQPMSGTTDDNGLVSTGIPYYQSVLSYKGMNLPNTIYTLIINNSYWHFKVTDASGSVRANTNISGTVLYC